jgi:hypothetical protein
VVLRVLLVRKELKVHKVHVAHKVLLVRKEHRGQWVHVERKGL